MKQTLPSPSPPHYIFECTECGTYPVSKETLRESVTPALRGELDKQVKDGAHGFKLKFERGCPRCKPSDTKARTATLTALVAVKEH